MTTKIEPFYRRQEIALPRLPNFLLPTDGSASISVAALDDQELQILGERWTKALIAHAQRLRAIKNGGDDDQA